MTTQPFDPVQYKEAQRQEWGSVAPGWKRWWQRIEAMLQPISERMIELADIQSGQLEATFRQAGFTQIHIESMTLPFEWLSPDDFVSFHQEVLTQLNALLAKFPVERQIKIRRAIAGAAEQYMMPDGILHMDNEVLLVVGEVRR